MINLLLLISGRYFRIIKKHIKYAEFADIVY